MIQTLGQMMMMIMMMTIITMMTMITVLMLTMMIMFRVKVIGADLIQTLGQMNRIRRPELLRRQVG